jgi:hypothetical protein
MALTSYRDETQTLSNLYDRRREDFSLPEDGIIVRRSQFRSRNVAVLPRRRYTKAHESPPPDGELAELLAVADREVAENACFSYPLFLPPGPVRARGAIILLHGLNERSWHKYLPWARALCGGTGKAVILFPLAFHMNRAPRLWSSPRPMMKLARRRQGALASLSGSSFVNAALSTRLEIEPERFFWSGLVSYLDVLQLVRQIRGGGHPHIAAGAACDLFGYSIGALLAQILLMSDPGGMFRRSRAFLFCGGATLDRLRPVSRKILDSHAGSSLRSFYGSGFGRKVARDGCLARAIRHSSRAGLYFSSLLARESFRRIRETRLHQIGARIFALALSRDAVVPGDEVAATLRGARHDIPVTMEILDFAYTYSHEDPFPAAAAGVDNHFRQVFGSASTWLA